MNGEEGPDCLEPAESLTTWLRDGSVRLRMTENGWKPVSIPSMVKKCCSEGGDHVAMAVKRDGVWQKTSYKEYYENIRCAAKGFIKLGLQPYHSVSIFGFNSPEWFLASLGAIFAGGFSTGLYPTNSAEANQFIMQDSETEILVCEDAAAVDKMRSVIGDVPSLKQIIQYTGEVTSQDVMTWKDFMALGSEPRLEEALNSRLKNMRINKCSLLVYTSGTTGKGLKDCYCH